MAGNGQGWPEIDPGPGGTHSADQKPTRDAAEHTLPTGNRPGPWRNLLCQSELNLGRGGTHSANRKSTREAAEHTLPTKKLTWDEAEHALPIKNQPGTRWNTLCRPEIDPGGGGTDSADRKLTGVVAEHTLPTGNRPGTRRNTL